MQGRADLTSCRCARPCRSGRRGGRAPSGGCHSPGSPRRPASSWLPASRRRTNPPQKTLRRNQTVSGSVPGLGFHRATKDPRWGNRKSCVGAGERNTSAVVASRGRVQTGERDRSSGFGDAVLLFSPSAVRLRDQVGRWASPLRVIWMGWTTFTFEPTCFPTTGGPARPASKYETSSSRFSETQ